MNIIDYNTKYDEDIKDLLVELQEYIVSIDKDGYNIINDEYREIEFKKTIKEINDFEGKMFLAVENDKAIGLIVGLINNEEQNTYEFRAPKRGRITELIVSSNCRAKGIGRQLMDEMETHFKLVGCKAILIEVFGYNEKAKSFYYRNNYSDRNLEVMKHI